MIDFSGALYHPDNVIEAADFGTPELLLEEAEAPVRREFRVTHYQE